MSAGANRKSRAGKGRWVGMVRVSLMWKATPESRPEGDEGMCDTEVWGKARRKKGRAR